MNNRWLRLSNYKIHRKMESIFHFIMVTLNVTPRQYIYYHLFLVVSINIEKLGRKANCSSYDKIVNFKFYWKTLNQYGIRGLEGNLTRLRSYLNNSQDRLYKIFQHFDINQPSFQWSDQVEFCLNNVEKCWIMLWSSLRGLWMIECN